jgi:hypothetical protein
LTDTSTPSNAGFIQINASASQFVRITGITYFTAVGAANKFQGGIQVFGTQHLRVDHCSFNSLTGNQAYMVGIRYGVRGVVDHNYSIGRSGLLDVDNSNGVGDGAWASPTGFGTSNFIFSENNYLVGQGTSAGGGIISGAGEDCIEGGSFVERYNVFINIPAAFQGHATKSEGGRGRGCRSFEFYNNYVTNTACCNFSPGGPKGATSLLWGNVVSSPHTFNYFFTGDTDRGSNIALKTEHNPAEGWGWCGTQTTSSISGSPPNGIGSQWDGNQNPVVGWPCLDGIGRGMTVDTISGSFSSSFTVPGVVNNANGCGPVTPQSGSTPPNCAAWPHQYLEPIYMFMNTLPTGMSGEVLLQDNVSVNNRDYYYDCNSYHSGCTANTSFNGTVGTGWGNLNGSQPAGGVARPATCTAGPGGTFGVSPPLPGGGATSYGVAWFAVDTNTLYVCTQTSPTTWTAIYSPYTYPHDLDTGP